MQLRNLWWISWSLSVFFTPSVVTSVSITFVSDGARTHARTHAAHPCIIFAKSWPRSSSHTHKKRITRSISFPRDDMSATKPLQLSLSSLMHVSSWSERRIHTASGTNFEAWNSLLLVRETQKSEIRMTESGMKKKKLDPSVSQHDDWLTHWDMKNKENGKVAKVYQR